MRLIPGTLLLVCLCAVPTVASPPEAAARPSLNDTPRARRLLAIARSYLPAHWRYPETTLGLGREWETELKSLLPVRVRPQRTSYTCGPASLGILLSHYGVHMTDEDLERVTRVTKDGIDPWFIRDAAFALGFSVTERYDASVKEILESLSAGHPVLIDFQATYLPSDDPKDDYGHYSVVVAADSRDLLIVDPSEVNPAHIRRIPISMLPGVWWDTFIRDNRRFQGYMLTVRPPAFHSERSRASAVTRWVPGSR